MRVHSIAMPAASKKSPGRRRKRPGGSWRTQSYCKRSVIEREEETEEEGRRRDGKESQLCYYFVIYLSKILGKKIY